MKAISPIFSKDEMLFCSVPVPPILNHKGGEFNFTDDQISKYGQSQTHPSIVFVPDGWNGHQYWLASTPYPNAIGVFENPCIYYADAENGNPPRVFTPIVGTALGNYTVINNPIVKVPNNSTTNSDPDLWLDTDNSIMWMISRENSNAYAVYSQKSANGQAWTQRGDRTTGFLWQKGTGDLVTKPEFLSPAIVKVGSKIRIYSLSGTAGIYDLNYKLNNGLCWGLWVMEGTTLEGSGDFSYVKKASILGKRGIEPWHMDMFVDSRTGYVYMVCSAKNNLTNTTDVYLAESTDGWNFYLFSKPLISGGYGHYRPTATIRSSDNLLIVYFSVVNAPSTAASYPNGESDIPVDGRAIGVCYKNFDEVLSELRADKVIGWV